MNLASNEKPKGILFDLDGVFYEGSKPVPGAASVAQWVTNQNIPHLFLTNTTSRPRSALLSKLQQLGINTTLEHLLTPPVAAVQYLTQHLAQGSVALFVPQATQNEFSTLPLVKGISDEVIGAVVVGDLGKSWDYDTLNRAFRYLMQKPSPILLSLGATRYWQNEDGLRMDVAPYVAALECASGIAPVVTGKPAKMFYQIALDLLQVNASQTLMIGDDIRGDIEGAQQAGLRAALVKTGKFRDSDLNLGIRPEVILETVCELPGWWQANSC